MQGAVLATCTGRRSEVSTPEPPENPLDFPRPFLFFFFAVAIGTVPDSSLKLVNPDCYRPGEAYSGKGSR